jgi:hypothetical protein
MRVLWWLVCAAATVGPGLLPLSAQEPDVRRELTQRGAPPEFVDAVMAQVTAARAAGLPVGPVADKALEGWAKHVAAPRVETALAQVRARLAVGRDALVLAGQATPSGAAVAGAAEALSRGLTPEDVGELVATAPSAETAVAGLAVAASLRAQGLERRAAVRAVRDALAHGVGAADLYELPSAVADLTRRGMAVGDLARRIMEGGGLPLPPMAGQGKGTGRPGDLPPGLSDKAKRGRK